MRAHHRSDGGRDERRLMTASGSQLGSEQHYCVQGAQFNGVFQVDFNHTFGPQPQGQEHYAKCTVKMNKSLARPGSLLPSPPEVSDDMNPDLSVMPCLC